MLSILIPTYNYNCLPLVQLLHQQVTQLCIPFEIICLDDCSDDVFILETNNHINNLDNCLFTQNKTNLGRAANRNKLGNMARFEQLLFLDADTMPISEDFISKYLPYLGTEQKAIYGGIKYTSKKPNQNQLLRWTYGTKRESVAVSKRKKNPYRSFLTLNFLIHKSILKKVPFNESIPNLRHEDSLFSFELQQHKILVEHIENPVYHLGLDDFTTAIRKEEESIVALKYLIDHQLIDPNYIKISRVFTILDKLKLTGLFAFSYTLTKPFFIKNLSSNKPSLFLLDLYRLGFFCKI